MLWLIASCKKDETNPSVSVKTVIVQDEGKFDFQPGLTYAVFDSLEYFINIETSPSGASVYYSINGGDILPKNTNYIPIGSNDKYISFFTTPDGICMEGNNRLDFGFGNDSLNAIVQATPNPTDSIISFSFSSNIRGKLNYNLFDITGQIKIKEEVFLDKNIYEDSLNLSGLQQGVYILIFNYGNSSNLSKFVKR